MAAAGLAVLSAVGESYSTPSRPTQRRTVAPVPHPTASERGSYRFRQSPDDVARLAAAQAKRDRKARVTQADG